MTEESDLRKLCSDMEMYQYLCHTLCVYIDLYQMYLLPEILQTPFAVKYCFLLEHPATFECTLPLEAIQEKNVFQIIWDSRDLVSSSVAEFSRCLGRL